MSHSLIPVMTPHGSLRLDKANDDFVLKSGLADRLEKGFERGSGHGLLHLRAGEAGSVLPPSLAWWRDLGMRFIAEHGENVTTMLFDGPKATMAIISNPLRSTRKSTRLA
jgi:hypothetical protein